MRVIFAKFPLFSKIQTLSHKLLVRKTSNHHHCNWHAQKPICRDLQVISSKNNLLTSVHNNTDDADDTNNYNKVIGIAQLNAFSCANNMSIYVAVYVQQYVGDSDC